MIALPIGDSWQLYLILLNLIGNFLNRQHTPIKRLAYSLEFVPECFFISKGNTVLSKSLQKRIYSQMLRILISSKLRMQHLYSILKMHSNLYHSMSTIRIHLKNVEIIVQVSSPFIKSYCSLVLASSIVSWCKESGIPMISAFVYFPVVLSLSKHHLYVMS